MSLLRIIHLLRAPLVAIALCALLAQQMIGFVLTASPVMAYESGLSLCLSGPPPSSDDPVDIAVHGAGFCPCTMQHAAGLLPVTHAVGQTNRLLLDWLLPSAMTGATEFATTGPPPARAPPTLLPSA